MKIKITKRGKIYKAESNGLSCYATSQYKALVKAVYYLQRAGIVKLAVR